MMLYSFFLALLLSVVASQQVETRCTIQGNTYFNGDFSITFGRSVAEHIPFIINTGGHEEVFFGYMLHASVQVTRENNLYDLREIGGVHDTMCGPSFPDGQYLITFSGSCTQIFFTLHSDYLCEARQAFFDDFFTLDAFSGCNRASSSIRGQFGVSEEDPTLSRRASAVTWGHEDYVIVSVGDDVAIYSQWIQFGNDVHMMDIASYPNGFTCDEGIVGDYELDWETASCGLQVCGLSDDCLARAQLWHGSRYNSYEGDECPPWDDTETDEFYGECSSGAQWDDHPYDCIDQTVTGGCAFCGGRINGLDVDLCIARDGLRCQEMFEQPGIQSYCNKAFECKAPAAALSVSVLFALSGILALLFA